MISRVFLFLAAAGAVGISAVPAKAEVKFFCNVKDTAKECAFTVFDENGGSLIFTLGAQQGHALGDELVGKKLCVSVVNVNRPNRVLDPNLMPACWKEKQAVVAAAVNQAQ